jgi:translation elongation factor EF-G
MKLLTALVVLGVAASVFAAEEADPAMAVIKRMRDQLRTVMIQQQKTEAERATLQAANVDLDAQLKSLDAKFKALAKESNTQKDADAKSIADLKAKIMEQEGEQSTIIVKLPVAEMFGFGNDLRSATQGRGIHPPAN